MKHFSLNIRWLIMSLLLCVGAGSALGDTKTEGFEKATAGTTYNSTQTYQASASDCGIGWTMYYGTVSTNNKLSGNKSAQMRWYSSATSNYPYIATTTAIDNLSNVTFNGKVGNTNVKVDVSYSTNGTTWTAIASGVAFTTTSTSYSYDVPSGGKYIKIGVSSSSTAPSSGNYALIIDDVVFTYTSASSAASTTTTIDASGITNTNFANGTAAGSLSASVKSGGNAVSGATVSWTSSDTGVATINSSGVVTLVGAGSTTITAYYAGVANQYEASSATYELNVTDFTVQDGVFDFTQGYDYGSGLPNDGTNHAANTPYVFKACNVTMTTSGTGNIAWYATPNLRFYSESAFTLSVPDGYVITGISFAGTQNVQNPSASTGTLSGNGTSATWTGNSQSVTFTRNTLNPFYTVITVTYETASTKTATSLSWSAPTAMVTMGESNTFPTLTTDPAGLTGITYSSSDETVATVASDGTVTLVAAGTTTITASYAGNDDYLPADDASYTLTVNPAAGTQPLTVTIGLNNTTYGTSYSGSITGTDLTNFTSVSGTLSNVTVEYAKGTGSNAYINNSQTRIYSGNTLTFTAPAGYKITSIAFSGSSWQSDFAGDSGTYDTNDHVWTGDASSVVFTGTNTDNLQLTQAVVTLVADQPACVSDLSLTPTTINLFASGTFSPVGTVESGAGTVSYTYECETEGLSVTSAGAYTASAEGTYEVTITATPSNTTDYKAVSAVVEVTVTDAREATVTTFPQVSYTVALGQTFSAPTATTKTTPGNVTLPEGRATYTYTSSNTSVARVDAATGAVTIIDAGATTITATYAGDNTDYQGSEGSYVLRVTDPNASDFTWNLAEASYSSASETQVQWTSDVATMTSERASDKTTAANNYLPTEYNSTRFYKDNSLTISPAEGNTVTSIVFVATTTGYASALASSTWTNATVTVSGTTVTVTPTDGTTDIVAAIGATCGFTGVTVHYSNASAIAKPVITPATGKYSERPQTINITCETEGVTIYYTTDGTIPTTSSSVFTAPFTVNRKTTVMAIAVKDGNSSRTASVDISFEVTAPEFNHEDRTVFADEYTVQITAQTGVTIYYITQSDQMYVTETGTTNDPTNSTIVTDVNGNPKLVSSARVYSDDLTFSQAMMITAVAVDADGNQSDPVTVEYQYTGEVGIPYTSRFAATLGDFTSDGTSSLYWRINTNKGADAIEKWGEERAYAYVTGKNADSGAQASLISPVFNLTNYTEASFSFIHAGAYFSSVDVSKNYCKVYVEEMNENGSVKSSSQVTVSGWYDLDKTSAGKYAFNRANSGDIDLTSYARKKIRIRFEFTTPNSSSDYGTWNVDQITVLATKAETKTEKAEMNAKGWTTYVFDHDIDAYQTSLNYTNNGKTLEIYKVTEFDRDEVVLQQLGLNENGSDNSERYIKAKTPVVIHGPAGETIEYVIYSDAIVSILKNNLLLASLEPNTVKATSDERFYVLQWNTEKDEPFFNRVKTNREIPDHKAYLNGVDEIEQVSTKTNNVKGIRVLGTDFEETATGIEEMQAAQETLKNGVIYNLAGQRVVNPTRGLYIINGKKVYLK